MGFYSRTDSNAQAGLCRVHRASRSRRNLSFASQWNIVNLDASTGNPSKRSRLKIRIAGPDGQPQIDTRWPPWAALIEELERRNIYPVVGEYGAQVDGLISMNHHKDAIRESRLSGVPPPRRILCLFEPAVVRPDMHKRRVLGQYGRVYSPSKLWAQSEETQFVNWRYPKLEIAWVPVGQQICAALMVNANKYSCVAGEQYSLRKQVVRQCSRESIPLDLWGYGWDSPNFRGQMAAARRCLQAHQVPRFRIRDLNPLQTNLGKGAVLNKHDLARKYKVAVVIENSSDYVSEKLYNAVDAGSLVVYVGPPLEMFGLSGAAYESTPDPKAVASCVRTALSLGVREVERVRQRQADVVASERANGDTTAVAAQLAARFAADLRASR